MSNSAPAGWYPQPDGGQRYWDGAAWTEHHQPASLPAVPPPPPMAPAPYGGPYQVAPKIPAVMLLASFFIPGLGTMLNGEAGKGIGILVGYVISCFFILLFLIGLPFAFGFWIWGMVDAYGGAVRWNARHGVIS